MWFIPGLYVVFPLPEGGIKVDTPRGDHVDIFSKKQRWAHVEILPWAHLTYMALICGANVVTIWHC